MIFECTPDENIDKVDKIDLQLLTKYIQILIVPWGMANIKKIRIKKIRNIRFKIYILRKG